MKRVLKNYRYNNFRKMYKYIQNTNIISFNVRNYVISTTSNKIFDILYELIRSNEHQMNRNRLK